MAANAAAVQHAWWRTAIERAGRGLAELKRIGALQFLPREWRVRCRLKVLQLYKPEG